MAPARRRAAARFLTRATAIAIAALGVMFASLLVLRHGPEGVVARRTFDAIVALEFGALIVLVMLLRGRLRRDMAAYEEQFSLFVAQRDRLNETSELLRGVLDSSPIAIIAMDESLEVLLWNASAERLFGWSAAETIGHVNPITIGASAAGSAALREQIAAEGLVLNQRTRRHRKDGSPIEINVSGARIHDSAGRTSGYVLLASDLTERSRLEAQLRQSQKMEAVGQLAGGIAHDFNNLLTIILSYGEILLQRHRGDRETTEQLGEIRLASERAAALTRQLLAFSRQQVLHPRVIDLNDSVATVERMLCRVLGENIVLEAKLAPDLGYVLADPGQIEQVLMNLAINARDAMPNGGRLTIETANAELDDTFVERHAPRIPPGKYATLVVSDNGAGIPSEIRERIFDPFFTTKEPGKGTGLGLATVFGIVEQSGGSIFVYSEPEHGATFRIYLPVVASDLAPDRSPSTRERRGGTETILLVEDDASVRRVTRMILVVAGYDVLEAENGEQAIRVMESQYRSIDLVITDVVMPGMGGPDFWREMRDRQLDAPVLYMSGYSRATLTSVELEAPNAGFIEKPFTAAALLEAVRASLDGRKRSARRV